MADKRVEIGSIVSMSARRLTAVARRFYADQCLRHAGALAYSSLLSLVPLLALMFAVLKGLGVQRRLEPLLLSRLALSPEVAQQIVGYIDHTNVTTLGTLGAATLVLMVISVLGSVEASFNYIWRVRRSRTWWRKASDYLSTVLLTPMLLLAAVAITSSLQEQALLRWVLRTEYVGGAVLRSLRLAPLVMNAVALAILYTVMPNRRPHFASIAIGAAVAGCLWQAVQIGYVALQIGVARYNAIYGALSQLPVMLVWLYVSWAIVLAGAELAAVIEFGGRRDAGDEVAAPWAVALQLLLRAAEQFRGAGGGVDIGAVARELHVSPDTTQALADALCAGGLLAATDGSPARVMLARDPRAISLADVAALVDVEPLPPGCDARVRALAEQSAAQRREAWRARHLADLLDA